jgi:hypothetical protein
MMVQKGGFTRPFFVRGLCHVRWTAGTPNPSQRWAEFGLANRPAVPPVEHSAVV